MNLFRITVIALADSERIELQLKGEPQQWFQWLSELQLTNMQIQLWWIRATHCSDIIIQHYR